jgi:hypothetical protein
MMMMMMMMMVVVVVVMMMRQEMPSPWQLYHIESLHLPGHPYTAVVLEAIINGTLAEIECG